MDDLYWRVVDFLQALAAGLLVGGTYGLMCVGLGIIFGVMRVVNFAHGDFMMLGMYAAFYLVTGFGTVAFLGPYIGPIVRARSASSSPLRAPSASIFSSRAPVSARRCAPPPTIQSRPLTLGSMSTARTASRSVSASASRRLPADCSQCRSHFSRTSAST